MTPIEKQSLIILINSIEQQIASLKSILCLAPENVSRGTSRIDAVSQFTDDSDDAKIEEALRIEEDKQQNFLQDLVQQATAEKLNGSGNLE